MRLEWLATVALESYFASREKRMRAVKKNFVSCVVGHATLNAILAPTHGL